MSLVVVQSWSDPVVAFDANWYWRLGYFLSHLRHSRCLSINKLVTLYISQIFLLIKVYLILSQFSLTKSVVKHSSKDDCLYIGIIF